MHQPVSADTLRDEIIEALGHVNHETKRAPHVRGNAQYPSKWDKLHAQLDGLLDLLDELNA